MNVFSTVARLGKDAELRTMPNGDSVCQFNAAFDSGYGENKTTTWLQCALFGKRGETLAGMLTKGKQIGLTGEIKLDKWTNRDGVEQQTLKMRVNDLTLLSGQQDNNRQQAPQNQQPQQQAPQGGGDFDQDIPFNARDKGMVI